jgi:hypothetical protein
MKYLLIVFYYYCNFKNYLFNYFVIKLRKYNYEQIYYHKLILLINYLLKKTQILIK